MKKFTEDMGINGHLTIIKRFNDGQEETLFDDHNIIVSGMGVGLSYLFTGSGSDTILDYQIDRFQVGVSGDVSLETSTTYQLSSALSSLDEYGTGTDLYIAHGPQLTNGSLSTNRVYAMIPKSKITRIGDTSVRYSLILDEDTANDLTGAYGETVYINEIGMLMKNPTGSAVDRPILVCYRNFSDIRKTSDFSLIFRWTINF